ncbi:unnamed protein product [Cylindrotheca closterium]|uniref:Uncharacterized protein n=1 Tax=Cylindrotheca closterium TaxID=2856 RepID=A0AAD2FMV6_9STRA|nr:unnamed protein product [Cylindrotheca closterium]
MGNCIARSPKVQQNRSSAGKEVMMSNITVHLPENATSLSATAVVRSSDLLHIAEPSDGSFVTLYPALEFSCQRLPNNNDNNTTMDPAASSTAQKSPVGKTPPRPTNVRQCNDDGSITATKTLLLRHSHSHSEKRSSSGPLTADAANTSYSRPVPRMCAREA